MNDTPAPGWYEHPGTPGALRYFDGSGWTEHTAPYPPAPVASSGPGVLTIARGVALGIGAVVAGLFFLAECQKSNAESEYITCLTGDYPTTCVDPSPND